jgi:hypothetical protein
LALQERVELSAAQFDLIRRVLDEHQGGEFMWTQHTVSSIESVCAGQHSLPSPPGEINDVGSLTRSKPTASSTTLL